MPGGSTHDVGARGDGARAADPRRPLYRARGAADDETVRALFLAATLVLACCACGGGREAAPLVRVPDLRGLPTQQALERLAGARLCVWHIDREPGLGSRRERVVAQR